jgi:hypothetical protein
MGSTAPTYRPPADSRDRRAERGAERPAKGGRRLGGGALTPPRLRALLRRIVTTPPSERGRLIALLAALENPPRAAELPADDPALVAVARHHRLSPLLSVVCETLPPPLAETFRRDRLVTAARNMILGRIGQECRGALTAARIRSIVLKGLDYETRLYGVAGARPTSDIDLLVPGEQRREAFAVLDGLGFEPRAAAPGFDDADYHEVAWTRAGAEVDLHMALAPLARCRIDYAQVWAEADQARAEHAEGLVLAPAHAAIFHALHMAIDHFAVPAIYLVDLTRLLPSGDDLRRAEATARLWHCHRAFTTAVALSAAFLPRWAVGKTIASPGPMAQRISRAYGSTRPLPRPEQILRKLTHLDTLSDALRYAAVQSRRNVVEQIERRVRGRSPRQRLDLQTKNQSGAP